MQLFFEHVTLGQNVFIKNNGILTEIHLQSVTYKYNDENKRYEVTAYNGDENLATTKMYRDIEQYKRNNPISVTKFYPRELGLHLSDFSGYYFDTITQCPKQWSFVKEITSFTINEGHTHREPKVNYNGYIPKDVFPTLEELLLYYPLNVKRLNEDTKLENGKLSFLLLDEKQEKIVNEFKQLMQRMAETNMRFFIEDGVMHFINLPKNIALSVSCRNDLDYNIQILEQNKVLIPNYMGEFYEGISMEFYDETNKKI